ncbi:MAG: hypothetical protein QOG64_2975, partial [Acidimicrobiaceae bacterium]|nr:hypothetical protein [Acidimicrobiaceae bacterium]
MQESDKHGSRLDEQLKHETESLTHGAGLEARSQESRLQQDPEPLPNPADRPDIPDNPGLGIHQPSVEHRSELAMAIKPAGFPAT